MSTMIARGFLSLLAACTPTALVRADAWTSPKEVAAAAQEFASAAEKLGKAIKEVSQDSPLVADVGSLSKSSAKLHDSVEKGTPYDDAKKDLAKIEGAYARFEAELKKAHDVHHEKPVADASKKAKAAFEDLKDHMAGKRPSGKPDEASFRLPQEVDR